MNVHFRCIGGRNTDVEHSYSGAAGDSGRGAGYRGGAFASTPPIASADSSADWLSSIDSLLSSTALPAADPSTNVAISVDGITILQEGSAHADSGTNGDIAIADGANSCADATGTDSYATVYGDGSTAVAGGVGSSTDIASVVGDDSHAVAGGAGSSENAALIYGDSSTSTAGGYGDNPGTLDIADIIGSNDTALAGSNATGVGDDDIAYVESNNLVPANATGLSDLIEISKQYDDWTANGGLPVVETAASVNPVTDLASSIDGSGAAADASNLWTDLLSALDPGSAAADSTNFLAELASLF
jgi:hypothetical protein